MEDRRRDFVESLGIDASASVLLRLDDPADLVRASSVSRSWRRFVITNGCCKKLCLRKFPEVSKFICAIEVRSSTLSENLKVGSSTDAEWERLEREHSVYSYLSHCLISATAKRDCILEPLGASSTDRYPDEGIQNTLQRGNRVNERWRYWSSKGESDSGVPETLTYKLCSKLCIVDEIKIKPYRAFFHDGFPIYSAEAVQFWMGHCTQGGTFITGEQATDQDAADYSWAYLSPEFPMAQEDVLQSFKLPHPVLCIGGIVQILLLNRAQKCNIDDLYYICVSCVEVIGHPLSPVFDVDIHGTTGDSVLKYFPDARDHTSPGVALKDEVGEPSGQHHPEARVQLEAWFQLEAWNVWSNLIRSMSSRTESDTDADADADVDNSESEAELIDDFP